MLRKPISGGTTCKAGADFRRWITDVRPDESTEEGRGDGNRHRLVNQAEWVAASSGNILARKE